MKVLFIGDIQKSIGSSIINKELYYSCNNIDKYHLSKNNILEIIKMIYLSKIVHIGEVSLKSTFLAIITKIIRKKITFLMHAGINLSKEYNDYPVRSKLFEKIIMYLSDKIIVPSENYLSNLNNDVYHQRYSSKYIVIYNGLNIKDININSISKQKNKIITLGGGRKEKGVLFLCKAIEKLNNKEITLTVIGRDGPDTDEIKSFSFVKYLGIIPREKMLLEMSSSYLFIQNSIYETFSIALIEAYLCKCKLISSQQVGANELFSPAFLKYHYSDINLLSTLIEKQFNNPVDYHLSINSISWENIANQYNLMWINL